MASKPKESLIQNNQVERKEENFQNKAKTTSHYHLQLFLVLH